MSFFDDASLAFLPSGAAGKDGKAYSIKPTDGTGDFTFSRGSNLAATRVGADGLIEKGRENLLLQSNQFDTTWVTSNGASTGSRVADPNGGNDAWELNYDGTIGGRIQQQVSVNDGSVYVFSIYARVPSGTKDIQFYTTISGSLITITLTTTWQRFELFRTNVGYTQAFPQLRDNTGVAGTIHIFQAQYEQGLAATDYIESGATTGKAGLLEDEPRFDYSGGASCPSLLLEPSRTQLIPYSEYFGTGWNLVTGTSVETNADTSPEGVENATRVTSVDHNEGLEYRNITVSENTDYTFSWYGKVTSGSETPNYSIRDASNNALIDSGDWPNVSNTEYKRQEVSFTTPAGCNNLWVRVSFYSGGAVDYYLYGAQLEAGSYPTSYIPNHSGGSVTRGGEDSAFELSVFDFFSLGTSESGTFFIETKYIGNNINSFVDVFSQGGSGINVWTTTSFQIRNTGGSNNFVVQNIASIVDDYIKIIIRKDLTTYNVFVNGVKSSTTATITNPLQWFDHLSLYRNNQNVKQMMEFPTALSDADCITLTTL